MMRALSNSDVVTLDKKNKCTLIRFERVGLIILQINEKRPNRLQFIQWQSTVRSSVAFNLQELPGPLVGPRYWLPPFSSLAIH